MLICGAKIKNGKVCGGKQLIFKFVILKDLLRVKFF